MAIAFHQTQLANGLTILAETNPDAHTAAVGYFVKAGARDEQPALMGVSHFLEHMMFKGTARRTADDVNREFDEIGANYNAYTSQENTVYYAQVLPEFLPRAVDLLGDMLRPSLRQADFDSEKQVILEEIGMYEDRPQWRLQDTLIETHFTGHPLAHRVLGTTDTITSLTAGQMKDYFDARYGPDRITVAAAGQIDFDAFVADVERITSGWQASGATRSDLAPALEDRDVTLVDPKLVRQYIALMSPAPSAQDDARHVAQVLADVLGDTDGSHLYWALVDPGLAEDADLAFYPQDGVGSFFGYAACDPQRAAEVERILLATIEGFVDRVTEEEVRRAKNKIATTVTLQGELPAGRMRRLGGLWTYLEAYEPLEDELDRIMRVTLDDVKTFIASNGWRPRTIVRLAPGRMTRTPGSDFRMTCR